MDINIETNLSEAEREEVEAWVNDHGTSEITDITIMDSVVMVHGPGQRRSPRPGANGRGLRIGCCLELRTSAAPETLAACHVVRGVPPSSGDARSTTLPNGVAAPGIAAA